MKKSFITSLIVLICIALVGLIAIQIYWIRNTIALRDSQFKRNVKTAVSDFNDILEREEAMERMKEYNLSRRFFTQLDSIKNARPHGNFVVTTQHEGITDTAVYVNSSGEMALKFGNQRHSTTFFNPFASSPRADSISQQLDRLDIAQAELFTELLASFFKLQIGNDFLSRHSYQSLDSLMKSSLRDVVGINAPFYFGIFDINDMPLVISDAAKDYLPELLEEGYRSRLFPADRIIEPLYLRIHFPTQDSYLLKSMWPLLFASAAFMLIVILAFGYSIRTILYQKKLSAIKNDFINNMTHELKTPIATISLACEALMDPIMSKSARRDHFLKMIKEENKRLGVLVENVLRSAVLDRGEMQLNKVNVDMHVVIDAAIRNIELQAQQKGGVIDTALDADKPILMGDKVHLTNVIYNLLDNAIKYSNESPLIKVSTHNTDSSIQIRVSDNGIGVRKEDHERIFEKLFRVHTGDVHNIKGFGLGLSYVKMIVEKHHGTVSVQSDLGKGSTFIIQLPFDYDI